MILNPFRIGSGGSDGPVLLVTVTGATATSVVATKNGVTKALTYDSTLGKWWATLPSTGTWTVTASGSIGNTKSTTVSANSVAIYEASLLLGILPDEFTRLEYIGSSGTQYIDTGLVSTNGHRWTGTVLFESILTGGTDAIAGAEGSPSGRNDIVYSSASSRGWCIGNQVSYYIHNSLTATANVKYVFDASAVGSNTPTLYVNGESVNFPTNVYPSSGLPVISDYIFAINAAGTPYYTSDPLRLYNDFCIYNTTDDSGLLAKFYPAKRNSDSVIGMYDIVRNQFFTNAGAGSFIAGSEA